MQQLEFEARDIAGAFVTARRAGHALAKYPGATPQSLSQAYSVQDAAIPAFGDGVSGWKVGRINPPWLAKLGTNRLAGPIFARSVQTLIAGHIPTGEVFAGGFGAAEAEFVFRIGTAPASGKCSFTTEEAAALVDAVFCGIEIASSPFSGINELGPLVTISDFGNNNGLLLGAEIPGWRTSGFEEWQVAMLIDGEPTGSGMASTFPGGALESVRFLLENLVSRKLPIAPGLLISSGAVTGVHEVANGQTIEARFGDFASMHCNIRHVAAQQRTVI